MDIIDNREQEEVYKTKTMPQKVAELTRFNGVSYSRVARELGISRGTCLTKRKKFGL